MIAIDYQKNVLMQPEKMCLRTEWTSVYNDDEQLLAMTPSASVCKNLFCRKEDVRER